MGKLVDWVKKSVKVGVVENWLTTAIGVAASVVLYGKEALDFLHTHEITDTKSLALAVLAVLFGVVTPSVKNK